MNLPQSAIHLLRGGAVRHKSWPAEMMAMVQVDDKFYIFRRDSHQPWRAESCSVASTPHLEGWEPADGLLLAHRLKWEHKKHQKPSCWQRLVSWLYNHAP